MYDFAHPIQDALEGITHSLCSLEFEDHRPLYNWVVEHCDLPAKPRQIEFARLGIDHTVMSKRKLRRLVEEGKVSGWDDPRMPTLCGLRRRGYTPKSIRNFCERIGVAKSANVVEYGFLEHCLREDLNETAQRVMAVTAPGQADHYQLSGGEDARRSPWRIIPWIPTPVPGRSPSPATCGWRRTISWKRRCPSTSASSRADRSAVSRAPTSSPAPAA